MAYYVTRGINRYSKSGTKINPATKKFDNLTDARAYAYKLVQKTKNSVGVFIDPNTKKRWDVGLGIVWIMKNLNDEREYGAVQYGQPNMDWPDTMYWRTDTLSKKYRAWESHWTILNPDGTLGKKYR